MAHAFIVRCTRRAILFFFFQFTRTVKFFLFINLLTESTTWKIVELAEGIELSRTSSIDPTLIFYHQHWRSVTRTLRPKWNTDECQGHRTLVTKIPTHGGQRYKAVWSILTFRRFCAFYPSSTPEVAFPAPRQKKWWNLYPPDTFMSSLQQTPSSWWQTRIAEPAAIRKIPWSPNSWSKN